jgi:hypothetical protein
MVKEPTTTVSLSDEDALLFREFQKNYYFFKVLMEEIKKHDLKTGNILLRLFFTKYGEVKGFQLVQTFSASEVELPISFT